MGNWVMGSKYLPNMAKGVNSKEDYDEIGDGMARFKYMPRIPGTDLIKAQAIIKSHKTVKKTGSNVSLSDMQKLIAQLLASLGPRG